MRIGKRTLPLDTTRMLNEPFDLYRVRRMQADMAVEKRLAGKFIHVSSRCVSLPPKGEDETVEEAIRRGEYRGVTLIATPTGTRRVARTKGLTYRKEEACKTN